MTKATKTLPLSLDNLSPRLPRFKEWLLDRGSAILATTNEYEVIRFRSSRGIAIIYRNSAGALNYQGGADGALIAHIKDDPWSAGFAKSKSGGAKRRSRNVATLIERDGSDCFFCCQPIEPGDETIEHLLPAVCGGGSHVANLVLAHGSCNSGAGRLSIMEKIKIREKARLEKCHSLPPV